MRQGPWSGNNSWAIYCPGDTAQIWAIINWHWIGLVAHEWAMKLLPRSGQCQQGNKWTMPMAHELKMTSLRIFFFHIFARTMQVLGDFRRKVTMTIHCSNLHHWRLGSYHFLSQYDVAAPPEPNFTGKRWTKDEGLGKNSYRSARQWTWHYVTYQSIWPHRKT